MLSKTSTTFVLISIAGAFLLSLACFSSVLASDSRDVVDNDLQPAQDIEYAETLIVPSIKIGKQGVGGVTFFNGTIINNTTNDGANNPVTFGDDLRVDGGIYRGPSKGTSDGQPIKVYDTMVPGLDNINDMGSSSLGWKDAYFDGTVNVGVLGGTGVISSANITDGTIATADLANNAVTSAKITDGTIVGGDIANDAITSAKIDDGTIVTADLVDSAVTSVKITNGTIVGGDVDSTTTLTTEGLNWNTAKTGYVAIQGSACTGDASINNINNTSASCASHNTGGEMWAFWGINLPHGAVVTSFGGLFTKNASDNLVCILYRYSINDNSSQSLASVSTAGISGMSRVNDTSIDYSTVDNSNYSYMAYCTSAPDTPASGVLEVHSFGITYTKASAD